MEQIAEVAQQLVNFYQKSSGYENITAMTESLMMAFEGQNIKLSPNDRKEFKEYFYKQF